MVKPMMTVDDVAEVLAYSKSHSYKIIERLNKELESKGYLTRPGMISRKYFYERTGLETLEEERRDSQ